MAVRQPAGLRSEQGKEFLDRHSGMPYESVKRPHRELFMLRNRKIRAHTRLGHDHMTSHLADDAPPGLCEGLYRFFVGNVGNARHAIRQILVSRAGCRVEGALWLFDPQPTATQQWPL